MDNCTTRQIYVIVRVTNQMPLECFPGGKKTRDTALFPCCSSTTGIGRHAPDGLRKTYKMRFKFSSWIQNQSVHGSNDYIQDQSMNTDFTFLMLTRTRSTDLLSVWVSAVSLAFSCRAILSFITSKYMAWKKHSGEINYYLSSMASRSGRKLLALHRFSHSGGNMNSC